MKSFGASCTLQKAPSPLAVLVSFTSSTAAASDAQASSCLPGVAISLPQHPRGLMLCFSVIFLFFSSVFL